MLSIDDRICRPRPAERVIPSPRGGRTPPPILPCFRPTQCKYQETSKGHNGCYCLFSFDQCDQSLQRPRLPSTAKSHARLKTSTIGFSIRPLGFRFAYLLTKWVNILLPMRTFYCRPGQVGNRRFPLLIIAFFRRLPRGIKGLDQHAFRCTHFAIDSQTKGRTCNRGRCHGTTRHTD